MRLFLNFLVLVLVSILVHATNGVEVEVFVDVTPHFVSLGPNESKTVRCRATLREAASSGGGINDVDGFGDFRIRTPDFSWNVDSKVFNVSKKAAACDRPQLNCWQEIGIRSLPGVAPPEGADGIHVFNCLVHATVQLANDSDASTVLKGGHHFHLKTIGGARVGESCGSAVKCSSGAVCENEKCVCPAGSGNEKDAFEDTICHVIADQTSHVTSTGQSLNVSAPATQMAPLTSQTAAPSISLPVATLAANATTPPPQVFIWEDNVNSSIEANSNSFSNSFSNSSIEAENKNISAESFRVESRPVPPTIPAPKERFIKTYFRISVFLMVATILVMIAVIITTALSVRFYKQRKNTPIRKEYSDDFPPQYFCKDLNEPEDILYQAFDNKALVRNDALNYPTSRFQ